MKVSIVGAGPAGLYAAILLKRHWPDIDLSVIEQNEADATFGFGVVFSDQALSFLGADDPETVALIEPAMTRWSDITVVHGGEAVRIDGIGFAGIGRLELLRLLQERARSLGIEPLYGQRLTSVDDLPASDLVIGADGLNSVVRGAKPDAFGAELDYLGNRFVWFGADRDYETLTQTFIQTDYGPMTAHHYSYAPGRSTFIIEMEPATFERARFEDRSQSEFRLECERLFAEPLEGARLIGNHSVWRRFPNLVCAQWFHGNRVLVGDALHTAHFSIGSGTRLALEDVVALVKALRESDLRVEEALASYQRQRQPVLNKLVSAARASADWYEHFGDAMRLDPWRFALSYIRRGGRISSERLQALCPGFVRDLRAKGINPEEAA